jgi:hypothetical protein
VILRTIFDLLAVMTAAAVFWILPLPQSSVSQPWRVHPAYLSLASLGMMLGALAAGAGNLLLSGFSEVGKSVIGGLAGAILAIEILKRRLGIAESTGLRFAAPPRRRNCRWAARFFFRDRGSHLRDARNPVLYKAVMMQRTATGAEPPDG